MYLNAHREVMLNARCDTRHKLFQSASLKRNMDASSTYLQEYN